MNLEDWDREFRELESRIESLKRATDKDTSAQAAYIARKSLTIKQIEISCNKIYLRFKRLASLPFRSTRQLKALIFWGNEIARMSIDYCKLHESYLKHRMWIQLIKTRFLGDPKLEQNPLISKEELETIRDKARGVTNIHRNIRSTYEDLERSEAEMRQIYDNLAVEQENYFAGHSLEKEWGFGAIRAQRNPVMEEVSKLLYGLAFESSGKVMDTRHIDWLSEHIDLKSQQILDQCRVLMSLGDRNIDFVRHYPKVEGIKKSLVELEDLESQLFRLTKATLTHLRPSTAILVKNSPTQVTTGSESVF